MVEAILLEWTCGTTCLVIFFAIDTLEVMSHRASFEVLSLGGLILKLGLQY